MAIDETTVVVASPHQVSSTVGTDAVILEVDQGAYYGLNEVGARVWELLKAPSTVGDIRETIASEYDVSPEQALSDVLALLEELASHGLIEVRRAAAP